MTALRTAAETIVRRLRGAGFEAVFAGGCVRDRLLGMEPSDYDIATSARPEQVEALFERTIPVGKQFGIVIVVIDGKSVQHFRLSMVDKRTFDLWFSDSNQPVLLAMTATSELVIPEGVDPARSRLRITLSAGSEKSTSIPNPSRLKSSITLNSR